MISIPALWLPIVVSAVLIFAASSIIHMFLGYHRNDFEKLSNEDAVLDALAPLALPPGDYVVPHASGMEALKSDEYRAKVERGPVAFMTVLQPSAVFKMGPQLGQWFVYTLVVGIVVAYVGGRTLPVGTEYLEVFRLTGTVAFASFALGAPQRSIWFKQKWSTTLKAAFDGLVYGCLVGGTFGWLWPA